MGRANSRRLAWALNIEMLEEYQFVSKAVAQRRDINLLCYSLHLRKSFPSFVLTKDVLDLGVGARALAALSPLKQRNHAQVSWISQI